MIEVKRNCSSNIHRDPGRIQFNSFTVKFTGPEAVMFEKILGSPGEPKPADVLTWILYRGLDKQIETMEHLYQERIE